MPPLTAESGNDDFCLSALLPVADLKNREGKRERSRGR
jgi:hypothetical protein